MAISELKVGERYEDYLGSFIVISITHSKNQCIILAEGLSGKNSPYVYTIHQIINAINRNGDRRSK